MGERDTLGSGIKTYEVSLTTSATQLKTLLSETTWRNGIKMEVRILPYVSAGTARSALLYGDSANQYGYVPAGVGEILPVPPDKLYLKSASGTITVSIAIVTI